MSDLFISKNAFNRFQIQDIPDTEFDKKGKNITGIAGYHGPLSNILGWILEKIFHKTVAVSGNDRIYYFNCKSLAKFLNRVDPEKYKDVERVAQETHSSVWTEKAIQGVLEAKKSKENKEVLNESLFEAVREGRVEEVDQLLQQDSANINTRNKDGVLLFEEAIKTQNGDLLALFMLKGANPSLKPSFSSGCQTLAEYADTLEWQDFSILEDLKNWLAFVD